MKYNNENAVVIRRSRRFSGGYIAASAFFFLLACTLLSRGIILFSMMVILLALIGLVIGLFTLKDRSAQIILDGKGIASRKIGQIPWGDIKSVHRESWPRGLEIIILELQGRESKSIRFQVQGLDMSPGQLYDLILSYITNNRGEP